MSAATEPSVANDYDADTETEVSVSSGRDEAGLVLRKLMLIAGFAHGVAGVAGTRDLGRNGAAQARRPRAGGGARRQRGRGVGGAQAGGEQRRKRHWSTGLIWHEQPAASKRKPSEVLVDKPGVEMSFRVPLG